MAQTVVVIGRFFLINSVLLLFFSQGAESQDGKINPDGYTSARTCSECHEDIYRSWNNSLHAMALSDPIFDTAFMMAVKEGGEEAKRLCLRCHAPMTMSNEDYDLKEGVTREGVSCDFCHTVQSLNPGNADQPYILAPGLVKRSIIKVADSPAHKVAYSELHGRSEFCSGCHNYKAPSGAALMSTYDEWKAGPYAAEGKQCQDCHMVLSKGNVVKAAIKDSRQQIHLHNLIHDRDQLKSALVVQITDVRQANNQVIVDLVVENVGSGHMVPTGLPTRQVVLTVTAESGSAIKKQERIYRKVVADSKGRPLDSDYETLLYGARILNDNRIAPREKRREHLTFDFRSLGRGTKVRAELTYVYRPMIVREQPMVIQLGEAERVTY